MLSLCHCIQIEEVNLSILTAILNRILTMTWRMIICNVKYKILVQGDSGYNIFHDSTIHKEKG
jgi:hypothetical protein